MAIKAFNKAEQHKYLFMDKIIRTGTRMTRIFMDNRIRVICVPFRLNLENMQISLCQGLFYILELSCEVCFGLMLFVLFYGTKMETIYCAA